MSSAASRPAGADDNVDPREVAHYTSLAETWWDPTGPFWPLHRLNALRTGYLREVLAAGFGRDAAGSAPLAGLDVLDVGCGGGILSESMAALGARVHGVDVVERNIAIAREHAARSKLPVRYQQAPVSTVLRDGRDYDVVLNMEVVEHVPDVPALLAECARLVRPGGMMVVATINRTALAWLLAIVGAEYVLRWLPRGTHRWRQFVTPAEVEIALSACGLDVTHRTGVRVNPLTRHFALTRIMAVNYMLVARRGQSESRPAP